MAYVKSIKNDLVQVGAKPEDLTQVAWNFINDSLRTTIALHVPVGKQKGGNRRWSVRCQFATVAQL